MNVNTGQTYGSYTEAVAAGNAPDDIVTGHPNAIRKLSHMVQARNKRNAARKRKRQMQAASRKRNR